MKEIPLKQFRYEQAIREGVGETAIANKIKRGLYPGLKLRRANKRVVFVCIKDLGTYIQSYPVLNQGTIPPPAWYPC